MDLHLNIYTVIVIMVIKYSSAGLFEEDMCERSRPEFSHTMGQPIIVPYLANQTKFLDISWSTENILTGFNCADAFEVEFQQVGGGRLTWSSWSAMVTCAPTRTSNKKIYHCKKFLNWRNCATRIRFRIIPHNSRNINMKVRASPYDEVVVHCLLGNPFRVDINRLSSGLYNKPLSPVEVTSRLFVAKSRDIRLRKIEESLERARRNKVIRNERIKQEQKEKEEEKNRKEEEVKQQSKTKQRKKVSSTIRPSTSRIPTFTKSWITTVTNQNIPTSKLQDNNNVNDADIEASGVDVDGVDYNEFDYGTGVIDERKDAEWERNVTTTDTSLICEYGKWTTWSNCTKKCGSGTKSRERYVNSGSKIACPFTNQTKSCFGTICQQTGEATMERATLLPGKYAEGRKKKGYEVRSNLKNFTNEEYTPLYCVTFKVLSATRSCLKNLEFKSLEKGSTVCSLCMKKSEEIRSRCKGDGEEQQVQGFKSMLETRCFGTWKRIKVEEECSCEIHHSFLFV